MTPRAQLDQKNLIFLYSCLKNSDYTSINFKGVADAHGLKVPTARMRYGRITRAIKKMIAGDTAENPPPADASKTAGTRQKKRKTVVEDSDDEDDIVPALKSVVKTSTSPDDDTINAKAKDDAGETSDTKTISASSTVQENKSSTIMNATTPPRTEKKAE